MPGSSSPAVVLVHGAFADASGFSGVIRELASQGRTVIAPPNPLRGLHSDAETVRALVASMDVPVLLVGHSYGGAVITQASAGLQNVAALVYLAAFAPDSGESCASATAQFAAPLLASTVRPSPYDAPGAAGGPDLSISQEGFRETFCGDVPVDLAEVMFASQRPLAAAAFGEEATAAGWREHRTWYQVASQDRAISPDAERFMAARMNAVTDEVDGSHTAFISRPVQAAAFISTALSAL